MFVDVTRSASPLHPPATVHGRQQLLTHLHSSGQCPGINTSAVGELQLDVDDIRRDPDWYKCCVSAQHLIVVAARNKEMSPLIWSYVSDYVRCAADPREMAAAAAAAGAGAGVTCPRSWSLLLLESARERHGTQETGTDELRQAVTCGHHPGHIPTLAIKCPHHHRQPSSAQRD